MNKSSLLTTLETLLVLTSGCGKEHPTPVVPEPEKSPVESRKRQIPRKVNFKPFTKEVPKILTKTSPIKIPRERNTPAEIEPTAKSPISKDVNGSEDFRKLTIYDQSQPLALIEARQLIEHNQELRNIEQTAEIVRPGQLSKAVTGFIETGMNYGNCSRMWDGNSLQIKMDDGTLERISSRKLNTNFIIRSKPECEWDHKTFYRAEIDTEGPEGDITEVRMIYSPFKENLDHKREVRITNTPGPFSEIQSGKVPLDSKYAKISKARTPDKILKPFREAVGTYRARSKISNRHK